MELKLLYDYEEWLKRKEEKDKEPNLLDGIIQLLLVQAAFVPNSFDGLSEEYKQILNEAYTNKVHETTYKQKELGIDTLTIEEKIEMLQKELDKDKE